MLIYSPDIFQQGRRGDKGPPGKDGPPVWRYTFYSLHLYKMIRRDTIYKNNKFCLLYIFLSFPKRELLIVNSKTTAVHLSAVSQILFSSTCVKSTDQIIFLNRALLISLKVTLALFFVNRVCLENLEHLAHREFVDQQLVSVHVLIYFSFSIE